jgi:hypothetical protein
VRIIKSVFGAERITVLGKTASFRHVNAGSTIACRNGDTLQVPPSQEGVVAGGHWAEAHVSGPGGATIEVTRARNGRVSVSCGRG